MTGNKQYNNGGLRKGKRLGYAKQRANEGAPKIIEPACSSHAGISEKVHHTEKGRNNVLCLSVLCVVVLVIFILLIVLLGRQCLLIMPMLGEENYKGGMEHSVYN